MMVQNVKRAPAGWGTRPGQVSKAYSKNILIIPQKSMVCKGEAQNNGRPAD